MPDSHSTRLTAMATRIGLAATAALLATAGFVPTAHADAPYSEYVALGDSWSADVSPVQKTAEFTPAACFQSSGNYPKQVASALRVPVFRDATCGGAKTVDMAEPQQVRGDQSTGPGVNPPQFDRLTPTTDLVTLGIGGNDAGLAAAAQDCVSGACKAKWVVDGTDRMSANIAETGNKVARTIQGIRSRSPHARILVVNYFAAITPAGQPCFPEAPVSAEDFTWLAQKQVELDEMLADAAARTGTELVDTYPGSIGHDVCQLPGIRWAEGAVPFSTTPLGTAVPFHPNQLGADHQARSVLQVIGG